MRKKLLLPLLTALLLTAALLGGMGTARAALAANDPVAEAVAFLQTQQQSDGGIDAFGFGASSASGTARALLGLAAQGYDPALLTAPSGLTALDYLAAQAVTYTHDASGTTSAHLFPANAGLLLAAVSAAGEDPRAFGGMDLIAELTATYHASSGAYSTTALLGWTSGAAGALNQSWAVLGLAAAGEAIPAPAADFLISLQEADGSWDWGSPDTTALALAALLGSGHYRPTDAPVQNGLDFLRAIQQENGGWRPSWDGDPLNADSTAWAMQALAAAGYAPDSAAWSDPAAALLSLQQADGRIGGTYANAYSTAEALFGLSGRPLYALGGRAQARRALTWMASLQNADGSWSNFGFPDTGATADAVLAFAAAGYDPASLTASGSLSTPLDYLAANAAAYAANDPASAGKLTLAVVAAGENPAAFGGVDLPRVLTATHYSATLGAFGVPTNTWHQAFAILGLRAAGADLPAGVTQTLLALQQPDGGWKYNLSPAAWNATTPDSTGLALEALAAAGVPATHPQIISATLYLRAGQDASGGWGNANSTAYALQGLLALGEDPADWLADGHSPLDVLRAYQKVDGPFVYQWDSPWSPPVDDFFATRQAVPALLRLPFPIASAPLMPFSSLPALPDSDRAVLGNFSAAYGTPGAVQISLDGDLDQDAVFTLTWQAQGAASWYTATLQRSGGILTASVPLTLPIVYDFRITANDPDGVQFGSQLALSLTVSDTLRPHQLFLPLIRR